MLKNSEVCIEGLIFLNQRLSVGDTRFHADHVRCLKSFS